MPRYNLPLETKIFLCNISIAFYLFTTNIEKSYYSINVGSKGVSKIFFTQSLTNLAVLESNFMSITSK